MKFYFHLLQDQTEAELKEKYSTSYGNLAFVQIMEPFPCSKFIQKFE